MATFVSTTLTKRTGATTTVFLPGITGANTGTLFESSTLAMFARKMIMSAAWNGGQRKSSVVFQIPQLSDDGLSVLRYAQAKIELIVPDGTPTENINDIVGYLEAAAKTATTNLNSLLVVGEGVW